VTTGPIRHLYTRILEPLVGPYIPLLAQNAHFRTSCWTLYPFTCTKRFIPSGYSLFYFFIYFIALFTAECRYLKSINFLKLIIIHPLATSLLLFFVLIYLILFVLISTPSFSALYLNLLNFFSVCPSLLLFLKFRLHKQGF
jgi:hypothetical protein